MKFLVLAAAIASFLSLAACNGNDVQKDNGVNDGFPAPGNNHGGYPNESHDAN